MHIYFSGVGGVGIGPLAQIAHDAGYTVSGSDAQDSPMVAQLRTSGLSVHTGQTAETIATIHNQNPIDWLVHTASLPDNHPELAFAREHGIRTSKRDELLATIIADKNLRLIAIAGTHGKTTTTGMLVWAFQQLNIPLSYSVGTTLSFAPSGKFDPASTYFVYECDEYDRNFLHFSPYFSLITSLDYDHPDTYKNEHVYKNAFCQFICQSDHTIIWEKDWQYLGKPELSANIDIYDDLMDLSSFTLAGNHVRHNAFLVQTALEKINDGQRSVDGEKNKILEIINSFPGTGRRFEKLADNLYSDYGHHPTEIAATLQLARELSDHVVLVYQPHQNVRQHEVRNQYTDCMQQAETIYWLPTYLTREDPSLPVFTPERLTSKLTNASEVHIADMNDQLWGAIQAARNEGKLVLVMGAGTIDEWVRSHL